MPGAPSSSPSFGERVGAVRLHLERPQLQQPRHHIVLVRLGNLAAIELTLTHIVVIAEVVHVHDAIDLRRMHCRAALPKQVGFFRRAFQQHVELLAQ